MIKLIYSNYPNSDVDDLCVGMELPADSNQPSNSCYDPDQEVVLMYI